MKRTKTAVLYATSIDVCCPDCGEPQPSPNDGDSSAWTHAEIAKAPGQLKCVACDATFHLFTQMAVQVRKT